MAPRSVGSVGRVGRYRELGQGSSAALPARSLHLLLRSRSVGQTVKFNHGKAFSAAAAAAVNVRRTVEAPPPPPLTATTTAAINPEVFPLACFPSYHAALHMARLRAITFWEFNFLFARSNPEGLWLQLDTKRPLKELEHAVQYVNFVVTSPHTGLLAVTLR